MAIQNGQTCLENNGIEERKSEAYAVKKAIEERVIAERNAVQQQKVSSTLHNSQVRGTGRNTQAVDTIENRGALNAPKIGTMMNPQIRGGYN